MGGREVALEELESQDLGCDKVLYSLDPCILGKGLASVAEVLVQLIVTELSETWDSLSLACEVCDETILTPIFLEAWDRFTALPVGIVRNSSRLFSSVGKIFFESGTLPLEDGILFVELSHKDLGSGPKYSCFTGTKGVCLGPLTMGGSR
jgi:hypothetical protein